jgi:hypothetical protein
MSDTVPSQNKGLLKRQRSATFTPRSDIFFDNDFVPSYSSSGFGAVFANETSDITFSRFEDDGVGSNGDNYGFSNGLARQPIDDLNPYLNPDFLQRTRSTESIRNQIREDGLVDFVPALTPRLRPDPSGRTPRSRQDLSDVDDVELELVGTTLVAKTANDQIRLDVRFVYISLLLLLRFIRHFVARLKYFVLFNTYA